MTKENAIRYLKSYSIHEFRYTVGKGGLSVKDYDFKKAFFGRKEVKHLIDLIKESELDPITVVRNEWSEIDDILGTSEYIGITALNYWAMIDAIVAELARELERMHLKEKRGTNYVKK